jgi:outer membrane protein assembly factor BamB
MNMSNIEVCRIGLRASLLTWVGLGILVITASSRSADWPQFRGPNGAGISIGKSSPIEFGPEKNELWRIPMGAGHSSPCIAGDALFVTTYDKELKRLAVVCVDRIKGEVRWENEVPARAIEKGHPSFNPASSSPATDGERVVAYFGSYGLVCFDMEGRKLWEFELPLTKSFAGNATSPAIFGDQVFLYRGSRVDHFVLSIDKVTGKELWRVQQEEPFTDEMACTACPIIAGDKLIVHTARSVQALAISTGEQVWVTKCATTATSTPVLAGDEVIVAAWNKMGEPALRPEVPSFEGLIAKHDKDGDERLSRDELPKLWLFHRPEGIEAPMNGGTIRFDWADENKDQEILADEWPGLLSKVENYRSRYKAHGILAIKVNSQGLVEDSDIRTLEKRGIPEVPSPLSHEGYLYFVKNGGLLTCLDIETGKRVYQERTRGRGTHYASPVIAGGNIYTISGEGRITVLSLGPDLEILAENDMEDSVFATPAVVDGTIYVRTHSALFAFQDHTIR